MVFATSLSAVLVVSFATLMAPQKNTTVAWVAYVAGASIATFLAYGTGIRLPYFGALICGFLTALYFHLREARRTAA
jgi:hypothetical protein